MSAIPLVISWKGAEIVYFMPESNKVYILKFLRRFLKTKNIRSFERLEYYDRQGRKTLDGSRLFRIEIV